MEKTRGWHNKEFLISLGSCDLLANGISTTKHTSVKVTNQPWVEYPANRPRLHDHGWLVKQVANEADDHGENRSEAESLHSYWGKVEV